MAAKFLTEFGLKVKGILPRKKKIEDFYEITNVLGSGNYSIVKRGIHKKTGEEFALKIIDKEVLSDYEKENLSTEVEILRTYGNHPNIVTLKEVFEDRKRLVLVLELMKGGELLQRLRRKKFYSEKEASNIIRKVLEATAYLHKNGIVHRDFKPDNLLFTTEEDDAELKIADFGFAHYIGEGSLQTVCGSPVYVAPEIVNEEKYNTAVDMWSIGVILYILLCGFPPFYHENAEAIFALIQAGKFSFPEPYWTKVSPSAKELVSLLLKLDAKERLTAQQALEHPWIVGLTASGEQQLEVPEKMIHQSLEYKTNADKHSGEFQRPSEDNSGKRRRAKAKAPKKDEKTKGDSLRQREDSRSREEGEKSKDNKDSLLRSKDEMKDGTKLKNKSKHEKSGETTTSSSNSDPSVSEDSCSDN